MDSPADRHGTRAPGADIVRQAAEWFARLQDPQAGAEDDAACAAWRARDPAHELAWQRMQALWGRFDVAAGPAGQSALGAGLAQRRPRGAKLRGAGALLGPAALVVAALAGFEEASSLLADHRTGSGERLTVQLADGSSLVLNGGSAVDVRYDAGHRRVILHRGEVLAQVQADPARPFVVETRAGTAQALGTRYLVRQEWDEGVRVTVLESRVRACSAANVPGCVDLGPGEQARLRDGSAPAAHPVDARAAAAWTQGRLVVDARPVAEVLDELARAHRGYLRYDAEALAGLQVSGVFPLDDPERALQLLAASLPLRVDHYTPWVTTVSRR